MVNKGEKMKEQKVQIKFPTFNHDGELESIADALDCNIFIPEDTLNQFIFRLRKIDEVLKEESDLSFLEICQKKRSLVLKLSARCDRLRERNTVISFAEEAEALANSSPFLSSKEVKGKIADIKARLDGYIDATRSSKNNMKFLRFAKALLLKAIKHEPVITKFNKKQNHIECKEKTPKEISLDSFTLAENLYELAETLYEEKISAFKTLLENNFSQDLQKEICFHVKNCGGAITKIESKEDIFKVISGVLGFAHITTDYYASLSPYPSAKEIKKIFSHNFY